MNTPLLKHKMLVLAAACFVFLLAALAYFTFLDGKVLRVPITFGTDELNIQLDKQEYHRGEVVQGTLQFCKHRKVKTKIQWALVDGTLTIFPSRESPLGKGCKDVHFNIEKIPKNAVVEKGLHFEGLIQYQVNPFSVISVPLKTVNFDVIQ